MTLATTRAALAELPVLHLDAQATAAFPAGGALLELAWMQGTARSAPSAAGVDACLVAPPPGAALPRAVSRVTGIQRDEWERGVAPESAWRRLLAAAAAVAPAPVPLVLHFARFEEPYLRELHRRHGSDAFPFEILCTHAIARRLLPDLPRRSLRALTGYFGAAVPAFRRSADHVRATAFVWGHLVLELERERVGTLAELRAWLARPAPRRERAARSYPLARERRLGLPRGPGVYRLLRWGGAVVYVGKAASLRQRVSGHFHACDGERALEMLSQVRDVSCTETATTLEAALLEADEIKRCAPPYNRALTVAERSLWFASSELGVLSPAPDVRHAVGPIASAAAFESLAALRTALAAELPTAVAVRAKAVGVAPTWAPEPAPFAEGRARFVSEHGRLATARDVLRVGARLWAARRAADAGAGEPDEPDGRETAGGDSRWDVDRVLEGLEETVLRAAHAVRRARWLVRLSESSLAWREPGRDRVRLLLIERGGVAMRADLEGDAAVPAPAGSRRSPADRRAAFDLATYDRLRVLTTELRALVAAGASVELRLGAHVHLSRRRLERVLRWV